MVYKTTNKINGKIYIGVHKTNNKEDGYLGSGKLLKRAIEKYGKQNFQRDILFECSSVEEMFQKEKQIVEIGKNVYNLKLGGDGGFDHLNGTEQHIMHLKSLSSSAGKIGGRKAFEKKVGVFKDGYKNPGQFKKGNKSQGFLGQQHSEEAKEKIGLANSKHQKGKKNSQYGTCWMSKSGRNVKIKKEDIDNYLEQGYIRGRLYLI